MKEISTVWHDQKQDPVLPYVICGVASLSNMINWFNIKYHMKYICADNDVLTALNSPTMRDRAKVLISQGRLDPSALDSRPDNPNTLNVDESKYTHLNNFVLMLAECGKFVTGSQFDFRIEYCTSEYIRSVLDQDYPVLVSGAFTKSGHFVLIVGYDDNGNWIVDDPYGNWLKGYDVEASGSKVLYPVNKMNSVLNTDDKGLIKIMRAYKQAKLRSDYETEGLVYPG